METLGAICAAFVIFGIAALAFFGGLIAISSLVTIHPGAWQCTKSEVIRQELPKEERCVQWTERQKK